MSERQKQSSKLSDDKLKKRAENAPKKSGAREVISNQFERNQDVAEYAKRRAKGICQLCNSRAPFNNKKSDPYLEVHHVEWLSREGDDTIYNTVALCPNCHRKMHILDLQKDKAYLKKLIK